MLQSRVGLAPSAQRPASRCIAVRAQKEDMARRGKEWLGALVQRFSPVAAKTDASPAVFTLDFEKSIKDLDQKISSVSEAA